MPLSQSPPRTQDDALTSYFFSGEAMRSRSVGTRLLSGVVAVPAPPARLAADWARETASSLAAGDVDTLPLARARMRWPDYRRCVQAVADWMRERGLPDLTGSSDVALMACRGARYHHDALQYGSAAFCNLFLSEDRDLDVHFPGTGQRIPLARGTVLLFDTAQPHAVIRRDAAGFDVADFAPARDLSQVFLTWELPIAHPDVARALGIVFDTDPATAARLDEEQVHSRGAPAEVCAASGRWRPVG
ncbi:hypothetical protein [Variovorax boronicumulans]|uniref:hypothetical protein n=1 Tax=Variovorax boronicumulans TaxID=436515 RepID=UPI001C55E272